MTTNSRTISDLQTDAELGLSFRVRQPIPTQPNMCVILLHGVGGNETNLLDLAADLDPETLVIFPRGPLQMGPQQFAWFRVMFTSAGPSIVAEEAEQSRKVLVHFVQQVQTRFGVAAQNTVIAGFSQGGILSASVALSAPESVAGFGILSGRILPELTPQIADKARLIKLRAFVGHGDFDSKLPVVWAQRSDQLLSELGVHNSSHRYPIDHGISAAMQDDFLEWAGHVINVASAASPSGDRD
jgi:phospholipase/carboxylesterase